MRYCKLVRTKFVEFIEVHPIELKYAMPESGVSLAMFWGGSSPVCVSLHNMRGVWKKYVQEASPPDMR